MKARLFLILCLVALTSCGTTSERKDTETENANVPEGNLEITGTIVSKDDKVPADGGVMLIVQPDGGETVTVEFESLFTNPPPTAERQALYQKTQRVQSGDRVHVVASRKDGHLRLEDIEKTP